MKTSKILASQVGIGHNIEVDFRNDVRENKDVRRYTDKMRVYYVDKLENDLIKFTDNTGFTYVVKADLEIKIFNRR